MIQLNNSNLKYLVENVIQKLMFEDVSNDDLIVYHGTPVEHEFNNKGNLRNGTFFSKSRQEASNYGRFIYEVTLKNSLDLFDTDNLSDCQLLIEKFGYLTDNYFEEDEEEYYIRTAENLQDHADSWKPIEGTKGVLNFLEQNYDGVWLYEGNYRNLLLFAPVMGKIENIKLVRK